MHPPTPQDFIQQKRYPNWTPVTCVREGAETPLFKQNFSDWLNRGEVTTFVGDKPKAVGNGISLFNQYIIYTCHCFLLPITAKPQKFDVSRMHQKGTRESQTLVDDGTGEIMDQKKDTRD